MSHSPSPTAPTDLNRVAATVALEKLTRNHQWRRRDTDAGSKSTKEKEKDSRKKIGLHFSVWHDTLSPFFSVPAIPPSFDKTAATSTKKTVRSMYQEAYIWAEAMIKQIETARFRGEVTTFTDAEFDALIANLGWRGLLERINPELRDSVEDLLPSPESTQSRDAPNNSEANLTPRNNYEGQDDDDDLFT
jgi:hypothetical protein